MSTRKICLTAAILVAAGLPAPAAEEPAGRYTMMPAEGGFVRLDTQTGITSICTKRNDVWACEAMPDSQQAMRNEITKLEAENKRLKDEMRLMEETMGLAGPKSGAPGEGLMSPDTGPPAPRAQIPTEKDVDRMFDYIEGMVRKFKERIERLDKEPPDGTRPESGTPKEADPGKDTPL